MKKTSPDIDKWYRKEDSDRDSDIHVVPRGFGHKTSVDCFCEPDLHHVDDETGVRVFSHKGPEEMKQ